MNLQRLTSEFARNKTKTIVLGGLLAVLGFVGVKAAFLDSSPRNASATPLAAAGSGVETPKSAAGTGDIEQKVQQAKALWQVMRTKRGVSADVAFKFSPEDSQYVRIYQPGPVPEAHQAEPLVPAAAPAGPTPEQRLATKRDQIIAESKQLMLQAVLMGENPAALINSRRVAINDVIDGFKIISIQDRQIRAVKDDVEVVIPLKDLMNRTK